LSVSYDKDVPPLNSSDLSELERVLLAILGAGLAPAAVANDPSFRLDLLSAETLSRLRGEPASTYLRSQSEVKPDFGVRVSDAIYDLEEKEVLSAGGPSPSGLIDLSGRQQPLVDRTVPINFDQHPTVFDRYLAGRCLDELLRHPDVYRFIMDKYADSSEVWQRVYEQYK
jgi:hypothetical protein